MRKGLNILDLVVSLKARILCFCLKKVQTTPKKPKYQIILEKIKKKPESLINSQSKQLYTLERSLFVPACLWINGITSKERPQRQEGDQGTTVGHHLGLRGGLAPGSDACKDWLSEALALLWGSSWPLRIFPGIPRFKKQLYTLLFYTGLPPACRHLLCLGNPTVLGKSGLPDATGALVFSPCSAPDSLQKACPPQFPTPRGFVFFWIFTVHVMSCINLLVPICRKKKKRKKPTSSNTQ